MPRTILAPLHGNESDNAVLESAHAIAEIFRSHIDCLFVRRDPMEIVAQTSAFGFGMPVIAPEIWTALEEEEEKRRNSAHSAFTAFCADRRTETATSPTRPCSISA